MEPLANQHLIDVRALSNKVKGFCNSGTKIRIYHGETNSTRTRDPALANTLDTSHLNRIISIDVAEKYALVEPSVSIGKLVEETLKYSLIPSVVMEFPEITVGGGIQGGAGESSSFKWGLFHEICEEYEIILGNGSIVHASPTEHADLYCGTACSYGTLGIITLIKIRLIPSKPYVRVRYINTLDFEGTLNTIRAETIKADFVDGILFNKGFGSVMAAYFSDKTTLPVKTFSKVSDEWFYIHSQNVTKRSVNYEELLPIRDYLFRYNRAAFWAGKYAFRHFKIPVWRLFRRLFNPLFTTKRLYKVLHATGIAQQYFVQDITVPYEGAKSFLEFLDDKLHIYPLWICPLRIDEKSRLAPTFIKGSLGINVGIWGEIDPSRYYELNREVEQFAMTVGGRKILYAHAYYPKEDFWNIYDYNWYKDIRNKYYAGTTFPDIYEKVFVAEKYIPAVWKGLKGLLKDKWRKQVSLK